MPDTGNGFAMILHPKDEFLAMDNRHSIPASNTSGEAGIGLPSPRRGNAALIERAVVLSLFIVLIGAVLLILRPFTTGLLFGTIVAIAAWPICVRLTQWGMSSSNAAIVMLLLLLTFVLVPIALAAPGLAADVKTLGERAAAWLGSSPKLPEWVAGIPLVGDQISDQWNRVFSGGNQLRETIVSYAKPIKEFFTLAAIGLTSSVVQLAVALIVATTLWSNGAAVGAATRDTLARLGGENLAKMADVAQGAVKGVFYGVAGTAAVQGILMALGLFIAGVPAAGPLGFITLLLAISQFGALFINLVWGGAAWWLYAQEGSGFAFWFIIIWGFAVTFSDNILKPLFIGGSINMPISLIILGVFGGFISFGFLGLFIGPTVLAIAYEVLALWRGRSVQT